MSVHSPLPNHRASCPAGGEGRAWSSEAGRVPTWVPLALLFLGLLGGLRWLEADARDRGLARIDVTRYGLETDAPWLDDEWFEDLEGLLLEADSVNADDEEAIAALAARVEALPFIEEVGPPMVRWPDGLNLPVRLREPVACVRVGGRDFLPVASDGTVLGGYSITPHLAYGGWLPALGPLDLLDREQGQVRPGDRVEVPALLAALDVADSMWRHLGPDELRELGRVVIDASAEDAPIFDRSGGSASPSRLPGGVMLELEQGRRVVFGRPPHPLHEGELPVNLKWGHVRTALGGREEGDPWRLLDTRFDRPVLLSEAEVLEFKARWEGDPDGGR